MATWQFDIALLSRKQFLKLFGELPPNLNDDMLEVAATWKDPLLPIDCEERISKFLREDNSWSPQIRMWGEEDGDRMSVLYDDVGQAEEISVRIDVRKPNHQFLEGLVAFANSIDAIFLVMEEYEIVEPKVDVLVKRMIQSNAWRFVEDPHEFLESFKTGR